MRDIIKRRASANLYAQRHRNKYRDEVNAQARARYAANPEYYRAKRKRNNNSIKGKNYRLMKDHGITIEQYHKMIANQHGLCAVCSRPPDGTGKRGWQVDHDHVTGQTRGLLCWQCNIGLGNFSDDIERMLSGVRYLEKYKNSAS